MSGADRDHVASATLLAWMDGELPPPDTAAVARHLEVCSMCSAALDEARRSAIEVSDLLQLVDAPPPAWGAGRVRRRVALRRLRRSGGMAAALVLLLAAGVLALAPGSAVRRWIAGETAVPARPAPAAEATPVRHLSVLPPASVDMLVARPADSLEIRALISDDPWLEVWTGAGERLESLELAEGRLTVRPGPVRLLRVTIPSGIRVRILVGGEVLLARDGRQGRGSAGAWRDSTVRVGPAGGPPPEP